MEMLSQRSHICEFVVIESALVMPMRMPEHFIAPAFSLWFAKLQFQSLLILVDGKERRIMKMSAGLLREKISKSMLEILPHYYHGDLSINHGLTAPGKSKSLSAADASGKSPQ